MFDREFYPLHELATRWHCSVGDLLHLGIQGRAQICVNIYGLASGITGERIEDGAEDGEQEFQPQTEDERREAAEMNAAFEAWSKRTTRNMPPGIFELKPDAVRFIDMPKGLPLELHEAMRFDGGWWNIEFDPPVTIDLPHLVMLHEEVERLDCEVNGAPTGQDKPLTTSRAHVSDKLAKMNQASAKFWGNADRDDRGTHPDNATVAAWLAQQGFSPTLADKAATIIRPEWAPTGRKPEE